MNQIKNISIPKVCHQSWQQMTTVTDGRYCQNCCKTVIDFTSMDSDDILAYLSARENTCGRFGSRQINNLNDCLLIENKSNFSWKGIVAGLAMIGLFPAYRSDAKTKPEIVQINPGFGTRMSGLKTDTVHDVIIRGRVTAKEDNSPMPGVTIRIKGTNIGTITDTNGNFIIHSPDSNQVIVVSFIGYISQEIPFSGNIDKLSNLQIQEEAAVLGGVMVVKHPFLIRIYYKFIKRPIRKIFG